MSEIDYRCTKCGAAGIKLWRQYQTFLENVRLMCGACALASQGKDGPLDEDGLRPVEHGERTDQIGWLVPAVPTKEMDSFWGYSSVPTARAEWWRRLPTR